MLATIIKTSNMKIKLLTLLTYIILSKYSIANETIKYRAYSKFCDSTSLFFNLENKSDNDTVFHDFTKFIKNNALIEYTKDRIYLYDDSNVFKFDIIDNISINNTNDSYKYTFGCTLGRGTKFVIMIRMMNNHTDITIGDENIVCEYLVNQILD